MAWRFKASKYKNSAPIVPKFENLIRDLSIGCYRSHGNFIAASSAFMAFNWDTQGSNLAVLPLDAKGRPNKATIPLVYAHSDFVTDFQFSPFDDGLLATASQDLTIKLWRIPEEGLTEEGLNQPELILPSQPRRVETVNFHPTADCVLATTSANSLVVWDLIQAQELFTFQDHEDEVQSVSWHNNGKLLATQCKDKILRIIDPRCGNVVAQCESHQGIKDSKVVWLGDKSADRLMTTGFSADRLREINIRDLRNLSTPQKNLTLDMSAGILVPLFDPDTNMCFLAGKGDRNIQFIEVTDRDPFIVEGLKYSGDQTKGACLVPKRAVDVMQGEVNRVLQLCDSSIVPITWQVPRKTYREYHADIYPETYGLESACGPASWWQGNNNRAPLINLDPKKRPKETLVVFQGPLAERDSNKTTTPTTTTKNGSGKHHSNGNVSDNHSNNGVANGNSPDLACSKNMFAKPNPRPRCVVKAHTAQQKAAPAPMAKPRLSPKPRPRVSHSVDEPHQNGSNSSVDNVDDGLAILRRQPSIRDRKKLFEENVRKSQEVNNSLQHNNRNSNNSNKPDVENKENQSLEEKEMDEKVIENNDLVVVDDDNVEEEEEEEEDPKPVGSGDQLKNNIFLALDKPKEALVVEPPKSRPASKMFVRVSKFKHLKGEVILKGRFENLKNLSRTVPAECNFIKANPERVAVPLTGPGGKLAVFETSKPGRLPDGVTPVLINGTTVLDFAFDPFDNSRLIAACDDGHLRVWSVPKEGLTRQMNEPAAVFPAHADKVRIVKWHPVAQDVVLSAAFDRTVRIWDLNNTEDPVVSLEGHQDQIYSAEWSKCGRYLATVCKDGKIRVYEPQTKGGPISEGGEIVAKKGARVVWVLNGQYLVVTGFSKSSERQVMVYRVSDLELVHTTVLDVSPAILVPHYDEDSNTLFLTGKGESTVTTFEVSVEAPHLFALSPYKPAGLHQGFAFLPKNVCDVRAVEFARAYRLTANTIEPVAFSVPRVKTAFFQDDLFPPTRVTWEPTMSAQEWFSSSQKQARTISLCPDDMKALSGGSSTRQPQVHNAAAAPCAVAAMSHIERREMAKQAETDMEQSVSNLLGQGSENATLEQDRMEGCEEEEWNE